MKFRIENNSIYRPHVSQGYAIYYPWEEDPFKKFFIDKILSHTLVSLDRCYIISKIVEHCSNFSGDLIECGVYKGGTAYIIANVLKEKNILDKKVLLFDTFNGMPKTEGHHTKGEFSDTSEEKVKKYLKDFNFVETYKGLIPQTFVGLKDKVFSFAHIDVDLYTSYIDCLNFIYPKLTFGGIIVFDEYGISGYSNLAKKAVDDFFKDKNETVISLLTGQGLVIKL